MQTPAGKECPHFYGNYYRGREQEECRLLMEHGLPWTPSLCETCPVPAIRQANACPHMRLRPALRRDLLPPWRQRLHIEAYCTKTTRPVSEPKVGCGQCHELPEAFRNILKE